MAQAVSNSSTGYSYQVLAVVKDMVSSEQINAYGIVTEWAAPKRTKGSDLLCTVKITDPSMVDSATGVVNTQDLLIFAPDRAQLPQIKKPGDIIRLHRSRTNHFNGRTQLVCSLGGINRRGPPASMCLFDSTPTPGSVFEEQPYQRSSQTYHFDSREKSILAHLRAFVQSGKWSTAQHNADKYRLLIRAIITTSTVEKAVFADVIGLVLAVEEESPDNPGSKVVWMWDGTDCPPFPPIVSTNINQGQAAGAAEEEDVEARAAAVLHHRPFPVATLPPAAAAALPMVGTALPILIRIDVLELPQPGSWAKFRNCGFQIVEGQLQGVYAKKSRWLPWHEDEKVLKIYTVRVAQKIISEWCSPGRSVIASATPHIDKDVTSLRQIAVDAVQPNAQPTAYRTTVRVLSHYPKLKDTDLFTLPARASKEATKADGYTDENAWMFALRLRVVDGSGTELDVDVWGKSGEEFFKEILPPQNLREAPAAKNKLISAFNYLTGNLEVPRLSTETVWLDLCIKSYFPELTEEERKKQEEESNNADGARGSGNDRIQRSVRYRVFDTRLLSPPSLL
jgi:Telomeric single stranded DNA binding POT1/CDC13